ncbi:MAG TPA: energy transducer TonB [Candidatus Odoribacter faecigallinarum]|uniref:Energy transducer TonB n=1 Tax=Candidatus Odoribacter faecigallinarum TaxID=2838706 RepID=A0A9D1UZN0_9BACT|nr:energy transducer TonB [Candidatus Odoribacter faecigallinarum]
MKKDFYRTIYRLLAGATKRVNWQWLNHWKMAMGVSLIAASCVGTNKKSPATQESAETMITTLEDIQEQEKKKVEEKQIESTCYMIIEDMPGFPGGNAGGYIKAHTYYPASALKEGKTGKVYVQFTIEKDGSIQNPRIARGIHPALDSVALEVISQLPKFQPAKSRGEPIAVNFTLPVTFTLEMLEKAKLQEESSKP